MKVLKGMKEEFFQAALQSAVKAEEGAQNMDYSPCTLPSSSRHTVRLPSSLYVQVVVFLALFPVVVPNKQNNSFKQD